MDIASILDALVPAAEYGGSLTPNTREAYESLRWTDQRPKPTWAQIEAAAVAGDPHGVVPESVTNFQARAMLLNTPPFSGDEGRSAFDDVDEHCRAVGGAVFQAWEYANEFYRRGQLIAVLQQMGNLSDAQINQMFRMAARINP